MADSSTSQTRPDSPSASSPFWGRNGSARSMPKRSDEARAATQGLRPFAGSLSGATSTPLLLDPRLEVVTAVEDAAAEAEATRTGAQVAPVPQGGHRSAEQLGGLGDGEQFGLAAGGIVGHGWLRWARVGCAPSREKAPFARDL